MGLREDREEFFATIRQSLGRTGGDVPQPPEASRLSSSREALQQRVLEVKTRCQRKADDLVIRLIDSATRARWNVFHSPSFEKAVEYIKSLAIEKKAKLVVRSDHTILERLSLEDALYSAGVTTHKAFGTAQHNIESRDALRQLMVSADIGVTGADYAIAETGSCVLIPRKGVSRLVSLLPPIHIAVVEKAQVLETPDDFLTLRRWEFVENGDVGSYMNFITGPSRTADIEQTLTVGVHGPKEVHMIILS